MCHIPIHLPHVRTFPSFPFSRALVDSVIFPKCCLCAKRHPLDQLTPLFIRRYTPFRITDLGFASIQCVTLCRELWRDASRVTDPTEVELVRQALRSAFESALASAEGYWTRRC